MTDYAIGAQDFIFWEGPPPLLTRSIVTSHTRPGADGLSQQLLGVWRQPFEVVLDAHFADMATALTAFGTYRGLIAGANQIVKYANVDWNATYSHQYGVTDVTMETVQTNVWLCGPGYAFPGGVSLKSRWKLTPVAV